MASASSGSSALSRSGNLYTNESVASLTRPWTRWHELTTSHQRNLESNRFKGQTLLFSATVMSGGSLVFALRSPPRVKFSGFLGIIALVAAVGGAFFLYRSFGFDTNEILTLRNKAKDDIEQKKPLGTVRQKYSTEVISDEEMNEWARYFLHTQTFEDFVKEQWSSISGLNLDEKTKELIQKKYKYTVYHPGNPHNLPLFSQVLASEFVFTPDEQVAVQNFQDLVKERVKKPPENYGLEYEELKRSKKPLAELDLVERPMYAWLFTIYIWQKSIGVEALTSGYKEELDFFGPYMEHCLLQNYIADTEVKLDYDKFVKRNGQAGIGYITNFNHFLRFLMQTDLGYVKIKADFWHAVEQFEAVAQVMDAILRQEWENMGPRDYITVRERTGIEQIEGIKDPETKEALALKFLRLPPLELADGVKYQRDIVALGITSEKIKEAIRESWGSTPLKEILDLEKEKRELILGAFPVQQLTDKALKEVADVSIEDIFREYSGLFDEGILTKDNSYFSEQMKNAPLDLLYPLINSSGEMIFKYQFMEGTHPKVKAVVWMFICINADYYLGVPKSHLPRLGGVLEKYKLIPGDVETVRSETQRMITNEQQQHEIMQRKIDRNAIDALAEIDRKVKEKQELVNSETQAKKAPYNEVVKKHQELQERQSALASEVATLGQKKTQDDEAIEQASKVVAEMQSKIKELEGIPKKLEENAKDYERAKEKLQDEITKLRSAKLMTPVIRALKEEIDTDTKKLLALEKAQQESMEFHKDLQNSKQQHVAGAEKPSKDSPVKTQEKVSEENAVRTLEQDREEKTREIQGLRTKIEQMNGKVNVALDEVSSDPKLNTFTKWVTYYDDLKGQLERRQKELQGTAFDLERQVKDIDRMKRSQDELVKELKDKTKRLETLDENVTQLAKQKGKLEKENENFQEEIDKKNEAILADKKKAEAECNAKLTKDQGLETARFNSAIETIKGKAHQKLGSFSEEAKKLAV